MFNLCLCGIQSGYTHKTDCPYPYYGINSALVEQWEKDRKEKAEILKRREAENVDNI